jgi:uncharacterized protein (DUF433 family)
LIPSFWIFFRGRSLRRGKGRLLERITVNTSIFGGKPIIRRRRLAVQHVLGMLAAGDTPELLLQGYPWLEMEDIQACLVYARFGSIAAALLGGREYEAYK